MTFSEEILGAKRPSAVRSVNLPRRERFFPSPADWRDEVLYFLLPDRFSDELNRPLLDRNDLDEARKIPTFADWRWDKWAKSGKELWQGGTLRGIKSRLNYLKTLGVTTLWVGPVFKQRAGQNTFHGYGLQDLLEVDAHFGTRADLVDLIDSAHEEGFRIILDIIYNHSGSNWIYPGGTPPANPKIPGKFKAKYQDGRYNFGSWRDVNDNPLPGNPTADDDGVWPSELQDKDRYTRAGSGSLDANQAELEDTNAEHKRSDFEVLRDFNLDASLLLDDLARCYKYWIALTDCDGFRIDTLKHVSLEQAKNFCGTIREFAANLGKANFLLVGEIAGGDYNQDRYLDVLGLNLDAALDIGDMRPTLTAVAKGLSHPAAYFDGFGAFNDFGMGSHRNIGRQHVSILDDHDHVFGTKIRFSANASSDHQIAGGVAMQLFVLGIPCIYSGTEQALIGRPPEPSEKDFLPDAGIADYYLREAMFGPEHPRKSGLEGLGVSPEGLDTSLPGFGPFGTHGRHCFDPTHSAYVRIAAMIAIRRQFPVLRSGRQYKRQVSFLGKPFDVYGPGEIVAWSRILDDEEALRVLNGHGTESRGADVIVDANLNPAGSSMTVILHTAEAAEPGFTGTHPVGSVLPVRRRPDGIAFVELRNISPSEVLVLTNHP
jgi:glycosidase